jgi:hypothetical protein
MAIAGFTAVVLLGLGAIVATTATTGQDEAVHDAPAATVDPTTAPPVVTAPSTTSATPAPTSAQSAVAVSGPNRPPAPATTRPLSPTTTAKPAAPLGGPVALAPLPDGWVTMATAKGSTGARSPVFHLQDHNTRLRYTSSGTFLAVFVVDATRGLDATAGYSDADCAGACTNGWMSLHDPAGDYYLLVQASGGHWAVDISEYSGAVPN